MRIRPLEDVDAAPAAEVAVAALPEVRSSHGDPTEWPRRRIGHLARAHPGGAWVAEHGGVVCGVALAVLHDGVWGLSLMAVDPSHQARGTGTRLLAAALEHGRHARGGLIVSSQDPKAMRMYARAGFELRPCVSVAGIADRAALPAGLRARPTEDFEAATDLSRGVRGGAYAPGDLAFVASRPDFAALAVPGRGFAIHNAQGSPAVLCASDDDAAADLLWSCLAAGTRGATVAADHLTAGQDWAVRVALAAGLALSPEGPVFTRGALGPLRPWVPSGTFL